MVFVKFPWPPLAPRRWRRWPISVRAAEADEDEIIPEVARPPARKQHAVSNVRRAVSNVGVSKRLRSKTPPDLLQATNQMQFTLNGLGVMGDDFAIALFPCVDCRALCFLSAASRQWVEYAMGWHAAYACRFGTPPLQNAQMIAAQGSWKSLYLRSHFFRIQPGLQALGIKRGTRYNSLQMNLGDRENGEDIRHLKLQLPVGTQTLRAAIIQFDLEGAMGEPHQLECAFSEEDVEDGEVSIIQVYSADLGTLELEQNQNFVGIRVGITVGELLAITGAAIADIVHLDVYNHCGISFELPMVPNVRFELDDGPLTNGPLSQGPFELDDGPFSYGSMKWWEVHLDRPLHCIEIDLSPPPMTDSASESE